MQKYSCRWHWWRTPEETCSHGVALGQTEHKHKTLIICKDTTKSEDLNLRPESLRGKTTYRWLPVTNLHNILDVPRSHPPTKRNWEPWRSLMTDWENFSQPRNPIIELNKVAQNLEYYSYPKRMLHVDSEHSTNGWCFCNRSCPEQWQLDVPTPARLISDAFQNSILVHTNFMLGEVIFERLFC